MNPVVVERPEVNSLGVRVNIGWWVWCPGCDKAHRFVDRLSGGPGWTFNRDFERPTFGPSLLCHYPTMEDVCHSYVVDGQWQFLGDSTHALAGQTVPMVPLPDWLL